MKLIEILLKFKHYRNGVDLWAKNRLQDYRVWYKSLCEETGQQRELQKWQPNYVYFIPLLSNHCYVKYLKANILKPIFSEFLFAILSPLSTT